MFRATIAPLLAFGFLCVGGIPKFGGAAERRVSGTDCAAEALTTANGGRLDSSLPWIIEAMRLDSNDPARLTLHRQRLAWLLQLQVTNSRRKEVAKQAAPASGFEWNGEGFVSPIEFNTSNELEQAVISPDGRWVAALAKDLSLQLAHGCSPFLWDMQHPELPPRFIGMKRLTGSTVTELEFGNPVGPLGRVGHIDRCDVGPPMAIP